MLRTRILKPSDVGVAAKLLKNGMLVAFPTETVYGLGARIYNEGAIRSIFTVKGRPSDNPLIVHIHQIEQIKEVATEIPDSFFVLAQTFFPGPLTIVLKRNVNVPDLVSANLQTIAVRMPSNEVARQLIKLVQEPLVAPSANLSGRPSATRPAHVLEDFNGKIAAVIDGGPSELGIESTVLNLTEKVPVLLRPGSITAQQIEQVLKCKVQLASHSSPVVSPGMKYSHYAPKTPIQIVRTKQELDSALSTYQEKTLLLSCKQIVNLPNHVEFFHLTSRDLYFHLRLADEKEFQQIIIVCDSEANKDEGLMNRLNKAAGR